MGLASGDHVARITLNWSSFSRCLRVSRHPLKGRLNGTHQVRIDALLNKNAKVAEEENLPLCPVTVHRIHTSESTSHILRNEYELWTLAKYRMIGNPLGRTSGPCP
ncbi:hypothetical protein CEXT_298821 [Caerostris extrusa]|uniref:Uncharacterized protein n=1 Tax=Caerostris extrusa TaxID=172846 RepID=A0AAV4X2T0_CAEEX|nr:hypothetical protein CEXT_298821 [Caerostris extrusa]